MSVKRSTCTSKEYVLDPAKLMVSLSNQREEYNATHCWMLDKVQVLLIAPLDLKSLNSPKVTKLPHLLYEKNPPRNDLNSRCSFLVKTHPIHPKVI